MRACPSCGNHYPASFTACPVDATPLGAFVEATTAETREAPIAVAPPRERRLVSVAVADPSRAQDRAATMGRLRQAAAEHDGAVEPLADQRVAVMFGRAISHGNEAIRAVRFALDVVGPGIRIGVATGRLVADDEAELLSGGTVGEASWRAQEARAGSVRVDEETVRQARGVFNVRDAGRYSFEIVGLRKRPRHIGRPVIMGVETPTIGRDAELELVRTTFFRVVERRLAMAITMVGPAGIGKTRLAHETRVFLEELPEPPRMPRIYYLEGRGDPLRARVPYGLVGDVVRNRAQLRAGDPEEMQRARLQETLAEGLGAERTTLDAATDALWEIVGLARTEGRAATAATATAEPRERRDRVEEAFVGFIAGLARRQPTAIVLEDMQWADPESLHLVDRLLRDVPDTPIFLLALTRPELLDTHPGPFSARHHTRIELGPLRAQAVRSLVAGVLGREPPESLLLRLEERAAGNPLFIEELLLALREAGAITRPHEEAAWVPSDTALEGLDAVPVGVEGVLQARLDRLPVSEREVLRCAAVLGRSFWPGALAALGARDVHAALDALRSRDLVNVRSESRFGREPELAFRQTLVRDVAYQRIPEGDRARLHLAAARWLKERGETDEATLAQHYERGGDTATAARHWLAAGQRALGDHAYDTALRHLARAIELAPTEAERFEPLAARTRAHHRLARRIDEAADLEALEAAALALGTDAAAAEAAELAGEYHLQRGAYDEAWRCFEQARERARIAEGDPGPGATWAELRLARLDWLAGRGEEALRKAEGAAAAAQALRRADLTARAIHMAGVALVSLGHLEEAAERYRDALRRIRELGDRYYEMTVSGGYAIVLQQLGQLESSLETSRDTIQLAERVGDAQMVGFAWHNMGLTLHWSGRTDEALRAEEHGLTVSDQVGNPRLRAASQFYQAIFLTDRGDTMSLSRAVEAAERCTALCDRLGFKQIGSPCLAVMSRALLGLGRADEALAAAQRAHAMLLELGSIEWGSEMVYFGLHLAHAAAGDAAAAREALGGTLRVIADKASRIADPIARATFLTALPSHRGYFEAARKEGIALAEVLR